MTPPDPPLQALFIDSPGPQISNVSHTGELPTYRHVNAICVVLLQKLEASEFCRAPRKSKFMR